MSTHTRRLEPLSPAYSKFVRIYYADGKKIVVEVPEDGTIKDAIALAEETLHPGLHFGWIYSFPMGQWVAIPSRDGQQIVHNRTYQKEEIYIDVAMPSGNLTKEK